MSMRAPTSGHRLPLIAVFLLSAFSAAIPLMDADCWFHLAGGRLIAVSGLPSTNTFSHTFPGQPWQNPEWLFDLLIFASERMGGTAGVQLFIMVLVGTAFTLSAAAALRRWGRPPGWGGTILLLGLSTIALAASRFRFVGRPHLITLAGLSLLLLLWEKRARRLPLWYFLVAIVWGNSHPGVAFGLGLCILLTLSLLLEGRHAEGRRAGVAAAAFLAGSLVNPGFHYPYLYTISHLWLFGASFPLQELVPPSRDLTPAFFPLALAVLAFVIFRMRRREIFYPLAALVFLLLCQKGIRFIPKFALVAIPGLFPWCAEMLGRIGRKAIRAGVLAVLAAAAALLCVQEYGLRRMFFPFGPGINRLMTPVKAADFIARRELPGNLFNDFSDGGYLIWRLFPRRRVFWDGRIFSYPHEFIRQASGDVSSRWPLLLDRFGVAYAVVNRIIGPRGVHELFVELGWRLVYLDGISLIYVRPGTPDAEMTRDDAFTLVQAGSNEGELVDKARRDPGGMRRELNRIDPSGLVQPGDFARFGAAALAAGDPALGERYFRASLIRHPDDPGLRFYLADALMASGKAGGAGKEYAEVARRARGTPLGREADLILKKMGIQE
jgi:hypothetical protein